MPKAVLWGVGDVTVRWTPRTPYEKLFEEPAECDRFLSHVCTTVRGLAVAAPSGARRSRS